MSALITKTVLERPNDLQVQRKRQREPCEWRSVTVETLAVLRKAAGDTDIKAAKACIEASAQRHADIENLSHINESKDLDQDLNVPTPITKAELNVELPDPKKSGVDPDEYLREMVLVLWGSKLEVKKGDDLRDHFPVITEKQIAAYNMAVVCATRQNQVDKLRELHNEKGRDALNCFNRFGEGLLNMACRRGFKDIVQFLLSDDVQLDVCVRDDYGRTPMHDACWSPEPQLEICNWLMEKDPSLFLIADKRCFTPFQYARKSDWHIWRQFIFDRRHLLAKLVVPETLSKFSNAEQA